DLALNAEQVSGVRAEREIPVVWAVAKGSMLNKVILVPLALAISAFAPWAVTPLLMVGGAFLCFEGAEKLAHRFLHSPHADAVEHESRVRANVDPQIDLVAFEKQKVKGAVRTDFILSAEIVTIALGTVANAPFAQRVAVLSAIAVVMTVGVYGLVAGIVKLDDLGLWLSKKSSAAAQQIGAWIVRAAPWLMKSLSVVGTVAMFLVGGGILVHGVHALAQGIDSLAARMAIGPLASLWDTLAEQTMNAGVGVLAGVVVLLCVTMFQRLRAR
ncbi:MAG: DUF808 domain-containing protein, partial [Giesbergeria sp.]